MQVTSFDGHILDRITQSWAWKFTGYPQPNLKWNENDRKSLCNLHSFDHPTKKKESPFPLWLKLKEEDYVFISIIMSKDSYQMVHEC